ncbi:MAG: peptide chain release factor N(5)-glutamine methyltransferase [Magnetococcales bacterium]|nr:peptide chain release factor N(5)-glutamine methyltransferase [Magnetococcales bacterium]
MATDRTWNVRELLRWTAGWLAGHGVDAPRLDSELLLAEALGVRRIDLFLDPDRPLILSELAAFKRLIKRRAAREPLAYIVGHCAFWSLELAVGPGVLIPRPESERLVELVLERYPERQTPLTILDIGVGSGAILLSLLSTYPRARGVGIDIATAALTCARHNAERLALHERVRILEGDLCAPLTADDHFTVIVANPPYVDPAVLPTLQPEVRDWEPRLALLADQAGLAVHRRLIPAARRFLEPGGLLALEIGIEQGAAVADEMARHGLESVIILEDYSHRPRVVCGVAPMGM